MIWMLLLLQQAPSIEEIRSSKIDSTDCVFLKSSQTGRYLILGNSDMMEVYAASDLHRIKEFGQAWTTAGFDENDAHLIIVGKDLVRYETSGWAEDATAPLEHAAIREPRIRVRPSDSLMPRQAWVNPDGSVLYPSINGGLRRASWKTGKLISEVVLGPEGNPDLPIRGIIGMSAETVFLDLGGKAGIVSGDRWWFLVASSKAFFAERCGDKVVLVGDSLESSYSPKTWKVLQCRTEEAAGFRASEKELLVSNEGHRRAAAFDPQSGWVFVAGDQGLRSFNAREFTAERRYPAVETPCRQLALDAPRRLLYTVEPSKLRCWKLKD